MKGNLIDAGMTTEAATAVAREINGAFKMAFANTATKGDIESTKSAIASLKSELLTEIRGADAARKAELPGKVFALLGAATALVVTVGGGFIAAARWFLAS